MGKTVDLYFTSSHKATPENAAAEAVVQNKMLLMIPNLSSVIPVYSCNTLVGCKICMLFDTKHMPAGLIQCSGRFLKVSSRLKQSCTPEAR